MTLDYTLDGLSIAPDACVLRITIDRDHRRNSLTDGMVSAMLDAIETAETTDSIRVISIASANGNFCSGFDLGERRKPDSPRRFGATQRSLRIDIHRFAQTLHECQTPIVTAVRGYAYGLGLGVALAADVCVAAHDARFKTPFVGNAMTPDSGTSWILPRLIGVARAKQMLLTGLEVSGAQAADWGMIAQSVPTTDVDEAAELVVQQFANAATVAVGFAKDLVYRGLTNDLGAHLRAEAAAMEMISRTDDFKEPRRAKRDARPIKFDGR